MGMDATELVEDVAEVDGLIKVVVTHWYLETGTGILEIFVLEVFEVTGSSSSGLDPTATMTGTELEPETPSTGTETGWGTGGVEVKVWGCGWAEDTMAGLDKLAERRSMTSAVGDPSSASSSYWISSACTLIGYFSNVIRQVYLL